MRRRSSLAALHGHQQSRIGYVQYYRVNRDNEKTGGMWLPSDFPKHTVGIDQLIGKPQFLGKGYGALMIKEFIKYITQTLEPQITTIIVDPDPTNIIAIKCYEKVGFATLGVVDAPWGSALLMRYDC